MTEGHKQCEWLGWFDRLDTDEAIRLAAYLPVVPVPDLEHLSVDEACQTLDRAWKAIFVPGPQHVQILRSLLDQSRGFARSMYPTVKEYNRLRCSGTQGAITSEPIRCLTGLAGVSKSSLVGAFERICRLQPTAEFQTDGQRLMIYPARRLEIGGQPAVRGILKGMANPMALAGRAMTEMSGLMDHVRDWFMATATSTLVVDEMQFFTQSRSASTKTSQLIMTLASLGPPLVYVANFSLVQKLMLRPQEEKDRLLAAPIVLNPPAADDSWWTVAVGEYMAVCPQTFKLDASVQVQALHRYTAGLFRALRQLLLQAYREARGQNKHQVTLEEVKLAYRSRIYSSHRKDVEDLASLAVSGLMAEKRPDLVCPFTEIQVAARASTVKLTLAQQQRNVSSWDPPSVLIESTISAHATAALRDLRRATDRPPEGPTSATVTRLPKRDPVSAQSLLQGAQVLRDVLTQPRAATKKVRSGAQTSDAKTS